MKQEQFDYEAMLMEKDAQEACAAERAWLEAGGPVGAQPDQGYNQWIRFRFVMEGFPEKYCLALKSYDDVSINCGKIFWGNKGDELTPDQLPRSIYPTSYVSELGACGRYCAAMGTMGKIILREQLDCNKTSTIGEPAVIFFWKCLYASYSKNIFYASHHWHSPQYDVEYTEDYPKDTAIGEVTIRVTYKKV